MVARKTGAQKNSKPNKSRGPAAVTAGGLFQKRRLAITAAYLTPAELEILRLLGQGCDLAQVAQARYVSRNTVRNQLALARERMDFRTNHQLVALVARAEALGEIGQLANPRPPRRAVGGTGSLVPSDSGA